MPKPGFLSTWLTAAYGKGFDPEERRTARAGDADGAQHFGLSSIAERCALIEASLRIESIPERGTTVLVELPF